jgi:hypothetical protein
MREFQIFFSGDGVNVDYFFRVPSLDTTGYINFGPTTVTILLLIVIFIGVAVFYKLFEHWTLTGWR